MIKALALTVGFGIFQFVGEEAQASLILVEGPRSDWSFSVAGRLFIPAKFIDKPKRPNQPNMVMPATQQAVWIVRSPNPLELGVCCPF